MITLRGTVLDHFGKMLAIAIGSDGEFVPVQEFRSMILRAFRTRNLPLFAKPFRGESVCVTLPSKGTTTR